jgi:fermentation-respiration switch protein FrsA (DUF1100 family)
MGMQGGIKGLYECIHEFSEVDYTADLRKVDKPTLVIHGDDDQIVPIAASAEKTAKIVKNSQLKVYKGGEQLNQLLAHRHSVPESVSDTEKGGAVRNKLQKRRFCAAAPPSFSLFCPPPSQNIRSNDYWSQQTLADLALDRCGQIGNKCRLQLRFVEESFNSERRACLTFILS